MSKSPLVTSRGRSPWLRLIPLLLVGFAILASSGCRTKLTFLSGAPYHSEFWVNNDALVAFPDSLRGEDYRVRVGGLLEKHTYIVPVEQVYFVETMAHLNGFFRNGVTPIYHADIEALGMGPDRAQEDSPEGPESLSELDRILDERTRRQEDRRSTTRSEREITEDAYQEAALEILRQRDPTYLVHFHDALFFFRDSRIVVNFRIRLIDRRTGNILLDHRYQGRSRRFDPADSHRTNENRLVSLTREAFNGPMRHFIRDAAHTLDARGVQ